MKSTTKTILLILKVTNSSPLQNSHSCPNPRFNFYWVSEQVSCQIFLWLEFQFCLIGNLINVQFTNVCRSNFRAKFTIQIFDYRKINTIFSPFSWHWPTFLILRPNLLHYLRKHGQPVKTQARAVMLGFSWWQRLSSTPTWVPRTSQAQKAVK